LANSGNAAPSDLDSLGSSVARFSSGCRVMRKLPEFGFDGRDDGVERFPLFVFFPTPLEDEE
jgi:hypothetical protein